MATLEITVKTLDSQNHKFDVNNELTVKEFKEKIADTVSVSAEAQRLIYCGRVLQDDKKLTEYGLDKKVVHLVQKLPPTQRPAASAGGSSSTRTTTSSSGSRRAGGAAGAHAGHAHARDGSMYLGALAFPSDIFSLQGTQEMINSAVQSRLTVIRSLLQRATRCVEALEDPNLPPPSPPGPTPSAAAAAAAATESDDNHPFQGFGSDIEGSFTTSMPLGDMPQTHAAADAMAGAVSAAVAGALSAIVSAVGNTMGTSNITILQQGTPPNSNQDRPESASNSQQVPSAAAAATSGQADEQGAAFSNPLGSDAGVGLSSNQARRSSPPSGNNNPPGGQRRQGIIHPRNFAESLEEIVSLQERLHPHMLRNAELLREDPVLPTGSNELGEAQRSFSLISETMHYLSHAYHSLSDLSVGFARSPPRSVGVRSLVLQPTAVLQAGFPIQAQINVMTNRVSPTSTASTTQASGAATTQASSHTATAQPATAQPTTVQSATAQTTTAQPANVQPTTAQSATAQPATTQPVILQATGERVRHFNISSGGDVELIMEVGPGGITLEHTSRPVSSAASTGNQGASIRGGLGPIQQGVPPPELIHNIIQAMAAQMAAIPHESAAQAAGGNAASTQTTVASTTGSPAAPGAPGQTSQARGNTATHPTTSTQTRSTARPHVHLAPVNWPGPQNFDPFLPCNSHHIQPLLRLRPQQIQTPSTGQATRAQAPSQQSRPPTAPTAAAAQRFATINIAQQIFGEGLGQGFMNPQSSLTVADFLASMPDYQYTQGDSFFTDLFVTMARHFTFRDLVQVSMRQSAPLNRLRQPLRQFVCEQLLRGDAPSSESISRCVDRILQEIQPYLEVVRASQLREDINFEASVRQFCQARLPELIQLVVNDDADTTQFGDHLMRLCGQFVRDLASLTLMCCHGGRQGLERILHRYVQVLTGDLEQSIQQWTSAHSRLPLRSFVQSLSHAPEHLDSFLVRSQPTTTEALPASAPPSIPTTPTTPATPTTQSASQAPANTDKEEAMECDGEEFVLAMEEPVTLVTAPVVTQEEGASALPPMELDATACDVVVGSEEWHSGIDPDWVPVITRDIQRQRRQSDQPAFSDAYLTGMSSKRRKLIANTKPQGTVNQVISETMVHAVGAAGVRGVDQHQLARQAISDSRLTDAYREEVRRSVRQRLVTNPDFVPERYPNANKYFDPPK